MMSNSQLWSENEVLREKLKEITRKLEKERELRLDLLAENLWMKRLLRQESSPGSASGKDSDDGGGGPTLRDVKRA